MKTFVLATFIAAASSASAQEITPFASLEYAFEADAVEASVGADFNFGQLTVTPQFTVDHVASVTDFQNAEITFDYAIRGNWNAYLTVETDRNFNYAETTIGTAVSF